MILLRSPVFPISWFILTTIAFLLPGAAIPKVNWLDKIWFDKWVHIGIFMVTVFLWTYMLAPRMSLPVKKIALFVAAFSLVYGVIIEITQHYLVPNRSFDYGDIIADLVGCLTGVVFSLRYIKK